MGQGFPHQHPVLENVILHPHVRRVACDDVTISRALLLYKIEFILASLVTDYAALRPRDGFSHPHQEHMKDTYILAYETRISVSTSGAAKFYKILHPMRWRHDFPCTTFV